MWPLHGVATAGAIIDGMAPGLRTPAGASWHVWRPIRFGWRVWASSIGALPSGSSRGLFCLLQGETVSGWLNLTCSIARNGGLRRPDADASWRDLRPLWHPKL